MTEINETNIPSLEELIARAEKAADFALEAQIQYERCLQDIASYHKPTYEYNGQIYQVRTRKDSKQGRTITYLCKLKDWPVTWLSRPKLTAEVASPETPTSDPVDVVTTSTAPEETIPEVIETTEETSEPVYANVSMQALQADTTTVIE